MNAVHPWCTFAHLHLSQNSVEQPAGAAAGSAAQPALRHTCAGAGDRDAVAHICYECVGCLCVGKDNSRQILWQKTISDR